MAQDEIIFYGHRNIQSLHKRTFEVTKDQDLTLRGDCIIGIRANKACVDLDPLLQNRLKQNSSLVTFEIIVGDQKFTITARGDSRLNLSHTHDMVVRKSAFICPRTASVRSDKSSMDIPRDMVLMLKDPNTKGMLRITVE